MSDRLNRQTAKDLREMKLSIEVDEQELRDRLGELNEERRCNGTGRASIYDLKRLLKNEDHLRDLAEQHLDQCIEELG